MTVLKRVAWTAFAAMLSISAGLAQQSREPVAAPVEGRELFERRCGICHLAGGLGTAALARRLGEQRALLQDRSDLLPQYVERIVRTGIGGMPRFTRAELSDEEAQRIAGYLSRARDDAG